LDEKNAANLDKIINAKFVLCLDDSSLKSNINESYKKFFHNNGGSNRWFDKSVQLIVASNGRAGVNAEVRLDYVYSVAHSG
jgi:hypothetical protein